MNTHAPHAVPHAVPPPAINPATLVVAVELSLADVQLLCDVLYGMPGLPVPATRWLPVAEALRAAGRAALTDALRPADAPPAPSPAPLKPAEALPA